MTAAYEYRHIVTLEETNALGNVYFTRHLSWQGQCREWFLREKAPTVLEALTRDLRIVTLSCHCDYFAEIVAFEEIVLHMRLKRITQNRMNLDFEYWRGSDLVAHGLQEIGIMRHDGHGLLPVAVPPDLIAALEIYR